MATFGHLGHDLPSLMASPFAKWFHFEASDEPGMVFRPSGEAFRPSVSLTAQLDDHGALQALRLSVDRKMIDDPRQAPFAADLVKSFLEAIARDRQIAALAQEVFSRNAHGVLMRGQGTHPPAEPSAGYRVYEGLAATWETQTGALTLRLANAAEVMGAIFEVHVTNGDQAAGWLSRLRAVFRKAVDG